MKLVNYHNNNLFPSSRNIESWFAPFFSGELLGEGASEKFLPAVNIASNEDEFMISAEVAGVKSEDLKIGIEEGILTISGEKKSSHEEKGCNYHRLESVYGEFTRKVRLPPEADAEKVSADCENGVLTIRIKKSESAKARAIPIKSK